MRSRDQPRKAERTVSPDPLPIRGEPPRRPEASRASELSSLSAVAEFASFLHELGPVDAFDPPTRTHSSARTGGIEFLLWRAVKDLERPAVCRAILGGFRELHQRGFVDDLFAAGVNAMSELGSWWTDDDARVALGRVGIDVDAVIEVLDYSSSATVIALFAVHSAHGDHRNAKILIVTETTVDVASHFEGDSAKLFDDAVLRRAALFAFLDGVRAAAAVAHEEAASRSRAEREVRRTILKAHRIVRQRDEDAQRAAADLNEALAAIRPRAERMGDNAAQFLDVVLSDEMSDPCAHDTPETRRVLQALTMFDDGDSRAAETLAMECRDVALHRTVTAAVNEATPENVHWALTWAVLVAAQLRLRTHPEDLEDVREGCSLALLAFELGVSGDHPARLELAADRVGGPVLNAGADLASHALKPTDAAASALFIVRGLAVASPRPELTAWVIGRAFADGLQREEKG